jgi:ornithine cyclodeaminase
MPAYLVASDDLAIKMVSVYDENPSHGLPLIHGLVTVFNAATGVPLAVMDAASVTALRTAAVTGLAIELLARPDAETAALFGAGVQGRAQLEAMCTARRLKSVRVFDPDKTRLSAFVKEVAGCDPIPEDVRPAASPTEAVTGSSIVTTATTSAEPVFDGNDLAPGTHVSAVGVWQRDRREIDDATVLSSKIVVDQREAAWVEAGDLIIPREKGLISEDSIHAELGEVVNGTRPGRESRDEITFFKSVGLGIQDAAVAGAIFRAADAKNIGTRIDLG